MAQSAENSPEDPAEFERRIQKLRREVVTAELQILELKDRLLAKETDRADAVALLGHGELMLEEKTSYIMTLDRALNARIRELEQECDRKTAEIDRRGSALSELQANADRARGERDEVIQKLSERLEAANQEINRAHRLAGEFAEKANRTEQTLATQVAALHATTTQLESLQSDLTAQTATSQSLGTDLAAQSAELASTRRELASIAAELATSRRQIEAIKTSLLWRLARPWRALVGPKV